MRTAKDCAMLAWLALTLLAGGCQAKKSAATPKDALGNVVRGLGEGDKDLFLASTTGATPERAGAIFDIWQGLKDYDAAYRARFGPKAAAEHPPSLFGFALPKAGDDLKIAEKGDAATAVLGGRPVRLRRIDGQWRLDLTSFGSAREAEVLAKAAPALVQFLRRMQEKAEKDANTPAEMQYAMRMGAAQALLPAMLDVLGALAADPNGRVESAAGGSSEGGAGGLSGQASGAGPAMARATAAMTARQKLAYAESHFAADLRLVKKHPWKSVPSAPVREAARRVFGLGSPAGAPPPGEARGVDFVGLSRMQVLSLVGNPSSKSTGGGEEVWTYAYKGTDLTARLTFRRDKVAQLSAGQS